MGEPNIPIDKSIMRTDAFHDLLERLRQHAEEHYRDHWSGRPDPLQHVFETAPHLAATVAPVSGSSAAPAASGGSSPTSRCWQPRTLTGLAGSSGGPGCGCPARSSSRRWLLLDHAQPESAAGRRSPAAAPRRPSGRSWAGATPSWAPRATSWAWWLRRWTTPSPGSTCRRPSSPGRGQQPRRAAPPSPRLRSGPRPAPTRSRDSSSCPHGRSTPARRRRRLRYAEGAPRHRPVHCCTAL